MFPQKSGKAGLISQRLDSEYVWIGATSEFLPIPDYAQAAVSANARHHFGAVARAAFSQSIGLLRPD